MKKSRVSIVGLMESNVKWTMLPNISFSNDKEYNNNLMRTQEKLETKQKKWQKREDYLSDKNNITSLSNSRKDAFPRLCGKIVVVLNLSPSRSIERPTIDDASMTLKS